MTNPNEQKPGEDRLPVIKSNLQLDFIDDKAIVAELQGRIEESWVYHFKQGGKEIWGLSKIGIDAACREMAKKGEAIREDGVTYDPDPNDPRYMLFKASASRWLVIVSKDGTEHKEVMLDRAFGTKRQCLYIITSDGVSKTPNPFWFELGSVKAFRNAKNRLISEEIRSQIIAMAKELGKVENLRSAEEANGKPSGQPKKETPTTPAQSEPEKPIPMRKFLGLHKNGASFMAVAKDIAQAKKIIMDMAAWQEKDFEIVPGDVIVKDQK